MPEPRIASALLLAIAATAHAQERAAFAPLRYDENWSAFCATRAAEKTSANESSPRVNSARGDHLAAPLKCLRLSDDDGHYVSFGGELRERVETVNATDFGRAEASADAYALHRFLLHADLHLGDSLRVFSQLGSHFESGRTDGPIPTDKDRFDVQQAFLDVSMSLGDGRATLRGGRQELVLGSSRIVSVRESPNIRRAFDGIRAFWQNAGLRFDTFYLRPVRIMPDAFDDKTNSTERLFGAQVSTRFPLAPVARADLYYLDYERDVARFASGTARERRQSVGARIYGKQEGVDWNFEVLGQFGSFGDGRIRAWTFASDTGYSLAGLAWQPRLGLKADIASGDRNPRNGTLQTFNALYPTPTYFSEASLIAPANIIDVQPTLTLSFSRTISLVMGWDFLWKERTADAVYTTPPPLTPVTGSAGGARRIGNQIRIEPSWKPTAHIEVRASFVHFEAGAGLVQAGARDINFGMLSGTYRF